MIKFKIKKYLPKPLKILWEITDRCNFKCIFCYNPTVSTGLKNELSHDEAIEFLEELKETKIAELVLTGGEPFLRNDLIEILKNASESGISVRVVSNGSLITEKIAKELKKIENFERVDISFHGVGKTYEYLTGGANYKHLTNQLNLLEKYEVPFGINLTLFKININEIQEILKISESFGAIRFCTRRLVHTGRGAICGGELSNKEIFDIFNHLNSIRSKYKLKIVTPKFPHDCFAGKVHCTITSDGNIIPCIFLPSFVAGNIRENTLLKIWEDPNAFKELRASQDKTGKCKNCKFAKKCSSGCPAEKFNLTKNINGKDLSIGECPNYVTQI